MSRKAPGPAVKAPEVSEALRDKGHDKAKAAAIANARAGPGKAPSRKGGQAPPCEDRTRDALHGRARAGVRGPVRHDQGGADRRAPGVNPAAETNFRR